MRAKRGPFINFCFCRLSTCYRYLIVGAAESCFNGQISHSLHGGQIANRHVRWSISGHFNGHRSKTGTDIADHQIVWLSSIDRLFYPPSRPPAGMRNPARSRRPSALATAPGRLGRAGCEGRPAAANRVYSGPYLAPYRHPPITPLRDLLEISHHGARGPTQPRPRIPPPLLKDRRLPAHRPPCPYRIRIFSAI